MAKQYADKLSANDKVDSVFIVRNKHIRITKNNKSYLTFELVDKSGEIVGRIWDNAEEMSKLFKDNDFVRVIGMVERFQNVLQMNVKQIQRLGQNKIDIDEFLPKTNKDIDIMFNQIISIIDSIKNKWLKNLLRAVFEVEEYRELFKRAPASVKMHNYYIGGLLEHTLSVASMCMEIDKYYKNINKDLLLAGAILHDIGKIYEYEYSRAFDYTDRGRLIGHIVIGTQMVKTKIAEIPEFPAELEMLLEHILLSHHGQYEWGSPKKPKVLEAVILHYLDDMDAKISGFQDMVEKSQEPDKKWTGRSFMFDNKML
ncbi:HD domain-containing protein, partial [bacterium]|nr:HD domain-containing protein [bacterium]